MTVQLVSFNNDFKIKQKILNQLQNHYKLDEIIKGTYWENGKGCAVGCIIHSSNHFDFEKIGIPEWVAHLIDILFEKMANQNAKEFPLKFISSIPVGFSNWQHIYHQLMIFILENVCVHTDYNIVKKAIDKIIIMHKEESTDEKKWFSAANYAANAAVRCTDIINLSTVASASGRSSAESASYSAMMIASKYGAKPASMYAIRSASMYAVRSNENHSYYSDITLQSQHRAAYAIAEKLIELLEIKK